MTAGLLCPTKLLLTNRNKKKKKHWLLKSQRKNVRFLVLFLMLIFFMNCFSPLQVTDLLQTEKIKRGKTRGMRDGVEKGYISVCHSRARWFFFFHADLLSAALIK